MVSILFRSAIFSDYKQLLLLDSTQTFSGLQQLLKRQSQADFTWLVAYLQAQPKTIVGQILINWQKYPIATLSDLLVHPDFRGQGVGTLLVQQAKEQALAKNFEQLLVLSNVDPNCPERRLYAKLGFTVYQTQALRTIPTRSGTLPVVTMIKNIQ